ncbi:MAG: sel1 repeat family protein, partial [Alphaproteobacteria bacterium]
MVAAWLTVFAPMVHSGQARADFSDGLAAYDAGDYAAAFAEWRALAESGDVEAQVAVA